MTFPAIRTGIGYDVHAFAAGRDLVLGGIRIPHDRGLAGHSDADVLLHAMADALLGAAGLGDIGQHFPPGDPTFAGADSLVLLVTAAGLVRASGWTIGNIDATVIAEAPKVNPHVPEMRAAIGRALGLDGDAIGIKATTNEGMGFVGRGEGIAALAVATVYREAPASTQTPGDRGTLPSPTPGDQDSPPGGGSTCAS